MTIFSKPSLIRILILLISLPITLITLTITVVTQPFVATISSTPPEVDPARLQSHVKHLSVDLYPRSFDQLQNIEMSAQYIHDEFVAAGASITIQDVTVRRTNYKNIIAKFGQSLARY